MYLIVRVVKAFPTQTPQNKLCGGVVKCLYFYIGKLEDIIIIIMLNMYCINVVDNYNTLIIMILPTVISTSLMLIIFYCLSVWDVQFPIGYVLCWRATIVGPADRLGRGVKYLSLLNSDNVTLSMLVNHHVVSSTEPVM